MMPQTVKLPTWYRVFAIVVGVIALAMAFVVLADPALGVLTLVLLLAFALLLIGVDRLMAGFTGHAIPLAMPMLAGPPTSAAPAASSPPKSPPSR